MITSPQVRRPGRAGRHDLRRRFLAGPDDPVVVEPIEIQSAGEPWRHATRRRDRTGQGSVGKRLRLPAFDRAEPPGKHGGDRGRARFTPGPHDHLQEFQQDSGLAAVHLREYTLRVNGVTRMFSVS
jgi:hypothetical protein